LLDILQGARDDLNARRMELELTQFDVRQMLDTEIAIKAAANYRHLRSLGVTIRKSNDLIIGTWCIENNVPLLHNDRDFKPMAEHLGLIEY
jgi:predicted nucleic acid-binding protein